MTDHCALLLDAAEAVRSVRDADSSAEQAASGRISYFEARRDLLGAAENCTSVAREFDREAQRQQARAQELGR